MKKKKSPQLLQDQWSSKWAFIFAATGAAVGLGNIWRFPYMAGENGGSAFVFIYLVCVLVIGLPVMIAEILIGRHARQNPVDAMASLAQAEHHSKRWGWVGWLGAVALVLILSFYSVVAGWSIAYLFKSFSGELVGLNAKQVTMVWTHFLSDPWELLLWHSVFMILTMGVIIRGVESGLEKASTYMMPLLYFILFVLVAYAARMGDFSHAWHYLFDFRAATITASVVVQAMGHAFFTLALGAGAMLTYGAYVPKKVNLAQSVVIIAGLDVLVAVLAGLAIFPLVFAFHLSPASGPGLMFVTLPISFASLPGGAMIGGLFFLLLLFAAWTSAINLAEPLVTILMNKGSMTRARASVMVGLVCWFMGIGSLLSFNVWSHVTLFGKWSVFAAVSGLPTDVLIPMGGFFFAVFAGWVLSKKTTQEEVPAGVYRLWRFLIRYVAPVAIAVIFFSLIL